MPSYNDIGQWATGTGDKFKLDPLGGIGAGDRSRQYLLGDLKKMEEGRLGLSGAEKRQATDAANQQAAANFQSQARDMGAAQLASGPMSAVSGRAAASQRQAAAQLSQAGAMASAETERTSTALAEQQRQAIRANLEREQDRQREDTQFWASLLLNPQMVGAAASAVGGLLAALA